MSELYEKMKARGIDMSWYEKNRHGDRMNTAVPLDDEMCSMGSIYLLKANGELWTIDHDGNAHHKVREGKTEIPKNIYLCMHCRRQFDDMPAAHPEIVG